MSRGAPDRQPGLADALRRSARIRTFGLPEALTYSYIKGFRFILFLSLVLGFSVWSCVVPNQVLEQPMVLTSRVFSRRRKGYLFQSYL